ncbi:MAG: bacteriorhodopsin [Alphaproteobacteria bacterium]|nr:bacteriorhodopsin [Alphaproteobacteria bacterium]
MGSLSPGQYGLVYNSFSFGVATFAAATIFFWLGRGQVAREYKTALTITGLVTFIAFYHYLRIFQSFDAAVMLEGGVVEATGKEFNRAYRYVDWLLTVPLLLIELILVMRLSRSETVSKSVSLGGAAALMIALGYPGEVADGINNTRLIWGVLSMIPFLYIVYTLYAGLGEAIKRQPDDVKGLVSLARNVTVVAWFFYPVVYFAPFVINLEGSASFAVIEVGYTVADIVAKAAFGVLIYTIAVRKSESENQSGPAMQPAE